jgi:hypothetical protein
MPPKLEITITEEELDAALERLLPHYGGYPQPIIDSRYLRIANGRGSEMDHRTVAAEEIVIKILGSLPKED